VEIKSKNWYGEVFALNYLSINKEKNEIIEGRDIKQEII